MGDNENTERGDVPDVRTDAASEGGRGNPATDGPFTSRPADAQPTTPTDEAEEPTEGEVDEGAEGAERTDRTGDRNTNAERTDEG